MNYIIIFLIICISILFHELGHFLTARWVKIPISRFSIGFGYKICGVRRGQTEYRFCLIPFGGYVLPRLEKETSWHSIPIIRRLCFMLGGPGANLLLGISLFAALEFILANSSTRITFSPPDGIASIIGIIALGNDINNNFANVLFFSMILNFNLALLNLLPIPPLDGSRVLIDLLSKIDPRILSLQQAIYKIGFLFVIVVSLTLVVRDTLHIIIT